MAQEETQEAGQAAAPESPEAGSSMPWHRQPGDRIAADWHRYRTGRPRDPMALSSVPGMPHPLTEPTIQLPSSDSFVRSTSMSANDDAPMAVEESEVVRFAMESCSRVPVTTTGSGEAAAVLAGPAEATERDLREGFLPVSRLVPLVSSLPLNHFEEFFAHVIMAPGAPHPMEERTTLPQGEDSMSPERKQSKKAIDGRRKAKSLL